MCQSFLEALETFLEPDLKEKKQPSYILKK